MKLKIIIFIIAIFTMNYLYADNVSNYSELIKNLSSEWKTEEINLINNIDITGTLTRQQKALEITIHGNGYKINGSSYLGIALGGFFDKYGDFYKLNIDKGIGENFIWNNFEKVIFECDYYGTINFGDNIIFSSNTAIIDTAIITAKHGSKINFGNNIIFSSNSYYQAGAILNNGSDIKIYGGALFINNTATRGSLSGGAIYNTGSLSLIADTGDIEFTGNKANDVSSAIYDYQGQINLYTLENTKIIFNDRIVSCDNISYLNIYPSYPSCFGGKIILNEDMSDFKGVINLYTGEIELQAKKDDNSNVNTNKFFNGRINLSSGTLNILNNTIDNITIYDWKSTENSNLKLDIDLRNNTNDNFTITSDFKPVSGILNITDINILEIDRRIGTITLFNNEKSPELNILTTGFYDGKEYIFSLSNIPGVLNYRLKDFITLKEVVNDTKTNTKIHSLVEEEIVTENLGNLGGTQLTIFGNGYDVDGKSNSGIVISDTQILNIDTGNGEKFIWKNFIASENNLEKGGVFFNGEKGALNIGSNISFYNNKSYGGGVIYNYRGVVNISSNVIFSTNISSKNGGAIYNYILGTVNISSNVKFLFNEAVKENYSSGGAICNYDTCKVNIGEDSYFSSNVSISGGAIYNRWNSIVTIQDGAKFINNKAKEIGGAICNHTISKLNLIANTNNIEFTGNTANGISNAIHDIGATINLWSSKNANIIFNDRITSEDNMSVLNINLSSGTLPTTGKIILNEDMSGYTGQVNLYGGEIELQAKMGDNNINTNKFFSGNINLSSGTLNILNNTIDNITVYDWKSTENSNLKLDIDLRNNTNDNFMVTNSATGQLNLTAINILGINKNSGQIILFNNEKSPKLNVLTTANFGGYEFTFTTSTIMGQLQYNQTGTLKTFKEVLNDTKPLIRSYSLANNEIETEDLENLGGTQLTIFGNNKNILGNNIKGIFVAIGKTLNIENVNNWSGFNNSYAAIKNEGTLNISGTNFSGNQEHDIINDGYLLLLNTVSNFENGIVGVGTTTISGVNINLEKALINQNKIEINSNGSLTGNATNINGEIINNGNLTFNGGENKNYISGKGTILIDSLVINNSMIVNNIIINKEKQLITSATNINGKIENNGILIFNDGINNSIIIGTGLTQLFNNVTNKANITQNNLEILKNKQLTNSNATITVNENLIVNNNAKIINDGELLISSGINNGIVEQIKQTSVMTIHGDFINNKIIKQNELKIKEIGKITTNASYLFGKILNDGSLIFIDGINNNQITGQGKTIIDGEVLNSSIIVTNVTINKNKQLTTSATDINGDIINNGNLIFNSGTENNNRITGTGNLYVNCNLINNNAIKQKELVLNSNIQMASSLNGSSSNSHLSVFINNSEIGVETLRLKDTMLKLTEKGSLAVDNLTSQNSAMDLANSLTQKHNFKIISVTDKLNLVVDADLTNKQMDTISADSFNGAGNINVNAINILSDNNEKETTKILFTSSTVLKDKITSITTASSKLYKYNIVYDNGYFNFINSGGNNPEINPILLETSIAKSVGGFVTQTTIFNQAFASMENIKSRILQVKNKITDESPLYASTANTIFFQKTNRIESGLWLRPFYSQETVNLDNLSVDNTLTGTLAGLNLATGEDCLVSLYLGYAGSEQKYENIKVSQTGYILGATGMLVKEQWYAGLTANINFNKAESQSSYGTDNFDMNMYSVGAKAGYNYEINDNWTLEPNLMLMYGNVNSQEYQTTQGAKVEGQSVANIIFEPQIKAKLNLENGWQPYGLLGYVINAGDKAKVKVEEVEFDGQKIGNYIEFGAGLDKSFKNSPWSLYIQLTGRSGDRTGFDGTFGIKYSFLTTKEK